MRRQESHQRVKIALEIESRALEFESALFEERALEESDASTNSSIDDVNDGGYIHAMNRSFSQNFTPYLLTWELRNARIPVSLCMVE